jgi:Na+/proline symporter
MFGIVPIVLSALGFLAADSSLGITLPEGVDASMIGVLAVSRLLPPIAIGIFVIMLLSALFSTLDSGLNAASSLYVTDVVRYTKEEREVLRKVDRKQHLTAEERAISKGLDVKGVRDSQLAMIGITVLGLLVALAANYIPGFGLKHLWWIFNTIAACVVVPTLLSLYWKRLDARGVFWGVLVAFVIGVPLFVYGNMINNAVWIVGASLFIIAVSTLFCLLLRRKEEVTSPS